MIVSEVVFDNEDVCNVRSDVCVLESRIQEDQKLIKQYSDVIEHIENTV